MRTPLPSVQVHRSSNSTPVTFSIGAPQFKCDPSYIQYRYTAVEMRPPLPSVEVHCSWNTTPVTFSTSTLHLKCDPGYIQSLPFISFILHNFYLLHSERNLFIALKKCYCTYWSLEWRRVTAIIGYRPEEVLLHLLVTGMKKYNCTYWSLDWRGGTALIGYQPEEMLLHLLVTGFRSVTAIILRFCLGLNFKFSH